MCSTCVHVCMERMYDVFMSKVFHVRLFTLQSYVSERKDSNMKACNVLLFVNEQVGRAVSTSHQRTATDLQGNAYLEPLFFSIFEEFFRAPCKSSHENKMLPWVWNKDIHQIAAISMK